MDLLVGLGNIGRQYINTRHNVGFMVLDFLVSNYFEGNWHYVRHLKSELYEFKNKIILAKPQTSMNNSGIAVKKIFTQFNLNITKLWIIHDDLDLRLGEYKIQRGVGPKLHYGLQSINNQLDDKNYWRVRIGVDNRSFKNRIAGEEYVLQNFKYEEKEKLDKVIHKVINQLSEKYIFFKI